MFLEGFIYVETPQKFFTPQIADHHVSEISTGKNRGRLEIVDLWFEFEIVFLDFLFLRIFHDMMCPKWSDLISKQKI